MYFLFTGNLFLGFSRMPGYGLLGSANFTPDSSPVKPRILFHSTQPISQPSSKTQRLGITISMP